jgi:hypothetical protein
MLPVSRCSRGSLIERQELGHLFLDDRDLDRDSAGSLRPCIARIIGCSAGSSLPGKAMVR